MHWFESAKGAKLEPAEPNPQLQTPGVLGPGGLGARSQLVAGLDRRLAGWTGGRSGANQVILQDEVADDRMQGRHTLIGIEGKTARCMLTPFDSSQTQLSIAASSVMNRPFGGYPPIGRPGTGP